MRCTLPAVYDINLRKNIQAMLSLYKDILVFVFFYLIVVLIFTMFANHFIGNPQKQQYDMFN
jgi:preprotein translocase subunit SecY